jgi:hypothetical protein
LKYFYFLLIIICYFQAFALAGEEVSDRSEFLTQLEVQSRFVDNVYYDYSRNITDATLRAHPHIYARGKPSHFFLDGDLNGIYEKYVSEKIQDHFDYSGKTKLYINAPTDQAFIFGASYNSFSDPSPNETYGRLLHNQILAYLDSITKTQGGGKYLANIKYYSETFTNSILTSQGSTLSSNYLSSNEVDGSLEFNKPFLPETNWLIRLTGGNKQFPNSAIAGTVLGSLLSPIYTKQNSNFGLLEGGVNGRLSEKSLLDASLGYLYRGYADSNTYNGPVLHVDFTEEITRNDQLITGYKYFISDSYWTDFFTDQEIFIGAARIIGDKLVFQSRLAFDYKSFSLPNKRDDQRVTGFLGARYSLNKTVKLTADLKVDILNSDAFNQLASSNSVNPDGTSVKFLDAPASYKAGSIGVGAIAQF